MPLHVAMARQENSRLRHPEATLCVGPIEVSAGWIAPVRGGLRSTVQGILSVPSHALAQAIAPREQGSLVRGGSCSTDSTTSASRRWRPRFLYQQGQPLLEGADSAATAEPGSSSWARACRTPLLKIASCPGSPPLWLVAAQGWIGAGCMAPPRMSRQRGRAEGWLLRL